MNTSIQRVIVYHDETKDVPGRNLKGHVLFFMPVTLSVESNTPLFGPYQDVYSPLELFMNELTRCRNDFSCDGKFHYSEVSGKTWKKYDFAYHKAIVLATDALRFKSPSIFPRPLRCKVAAIFYPKGADWKIYGGDTRKEKILRHDETLLRILLKGACHYLYDWSNTVEIEKIITDGEPAHRKFNDDRVVWRLTYDDYLGRSPLRDYVTISSDVSIIHLPSDHKKHHPNREEYMHANLLQVTDLLLGAIMRACYVGTKKIKKVPVIDEHCSKKDVFAQPVKEMLEKRKRGKWFKNSGHYKSFVVTQITFVKDGINFQEVQSAFIQDEDLFSMTLPFSDRVT